MLTSLSDSEGDSDEVSGVTSLFLFLCWAQDSVTAPLLSELHPTIGGTVGEVTP